LHDEAAIASRERRGEIFLSGSAFQPATPLNVTLDTAHPKRQGNYFKNAIGIKITVVIVYLIHLLINAPERSYALWRTP
jgi:hypothetical protein